MAADPVTALSTSRGRQPGEPERRPYAVTPGKVTPYQRPGNLPGSTSGGEGDPGREGLASLLPDGTQLPGYTGT